MSPAFSMSSALLALAGGALIGLAASLLLIAVGRVAGISGILAGALLPGEDLGARSVRRAFLVGLIAAGVLIALVAPDLLGAAAPLTAGAVTMALVGGIVVGVGTRIGGGCTSGHGVCGISRGSRRSIVAVAVFIGTAMLTVLVLRLVGAAP
jgi:uncharacterized membrane protein YedE/YeeE